MSHCASVVKFILSVDPNQQSTLETRYRNSVLTVFTMAAAYKK